MSAAMHSKVLEILLRSLAPEGPEHRLAPRVDWSDLWERARDHCLVPYLNRVWSESGFTTAIPQTVAEQFATASSSNATRNKFLLKFLEELCTALESHSVPVLISKGLPISCTYYGDLGLRVLYDLDLIIEEEHRGTAFKVLGRLGYVPFFAGQYERSIQTLFWRPKPYHWGPEQVFDPEAPCFVELHTRPWEPHWHGFGLDCQLDLWPGARYQAIESVNLRIPCQEKLLIHLAVHYACNVVEGNARLMHLLDIILLLRSRGGQLDWDQILDGIHRSHVAAFCCVAFDLAARIGSTPIPKTFMSSLRRSTPAGIQQWLRSRGVEDAAAMSVRRLDRSLIYFLHWHMAGGWRERSRVLLHSIRTPWQEGTGRGRWRSAAIRMAQRIKHLPISSRFRKRIRVDQVEGGSE